MQNNRNLVGFLIICADAFLIYGIFRITFFIRNLLPVWVTTNTILWIDTQPVAHLAVILNIGIFYILELYPGYGLTAVKELERMGRGITLAFFLLAAISYLNKPFQEFPRSIVLAAWVISLGILPIARFLIRNLLSRMPWYGMPVIVYGDSPWADDIANSIKKIRRIGWLVQQVHPLKDILQQNIGVQKHIMAIVALQASTPIEGIARILNQRYRRVVLVRQTDNFGSLWVESRDLEGRLGLEFRYQLFERRLAWFKRAVDIFGALILLIILSPFMGIIALLIKIDSPGGIIFHQTRLGYKESLFKLIKFRTMVLDAEDRLADLLRNNSLAKDEYSRFHKLHFDPRVTRIGKWLRRYSLDELPQLWNVLKGDMSLFGPRAYMPREFDDMGTYASVILRVKPGMTGWWQVLGRHKTLFQKRLTMDEYYISNWSIWMDLYIFLKTIGVILSGKGA